MIVEHFQYNNWTEILNKCLGDLKLKYPDQSETTIAKEIGMTRATFNRIKNEDKLPRLDNIIKIILGSDNINILTKAMDLHDKGLGEKLKFALEVSAEEKNKISLKDTIKQLINDPDYFVTYLLCATSKGCHEETIYDVVGHKTQKIIEHFKSLDIIMEFNNKLHLKNKGVIIRDFSDYKHHLKTYSNYYHPSHVGKERNYCHSLTEGLNNDGILELQKIHKDFHKRTRDLMRNTKYHGLTPIFSVAFCDSFTQIKNEI